MRQWLLDCAKQPNVGYTPETVAAARCRGAGGRGGDNVNASPAHAGDSDSESRLPRGAAGVSGALARVVPSA